MMIEKSIIKNQSCSIDELGDCCGYYMYSGEDTYSFKWGDILFINAGNLNNEYPYHDRDRLVTILNLNTKSMWQNELPGDWCSTTVYKHSLNIDMKVKNELE